MSADRSLFLESPSRRVAIYRNELLPWSETFVRAQAETLERYSPLYLGMERLTNGLSLNGPIVTATSQGSRLRRVARAAFLETGWSPGLQRQLRSLHPLLLHAHFATDACVVLPLARRSRLPLIVTLHGYDVTTSDESHRATRLGRLYLRRRAQLFASAGAFLCVSRFIQRTALERGYPAEKLVHCPIGVPLDFFSARENAPREEIVLFTGRLVEKKGCAHLLQAMIQVEARCPSVRLIILGDGPLRKPLEAIARRTLRNCHFLGAQPIAVVKRWMQRSRVFCVPSITAASGDAEGLGMVFCEAQACGLPVVSTLSGGIPEVVEHGVTGLLVEEGDTRGLAASIEHYLTGRIRWHDASRAARQRTERCFDLNRQTEQLETYYDRVLDLESRESGAEVNQYECRLQHR